MVITLIKKVFLKYKIPVILCVISYFSIQIQGILMSLFMGGIIDAIAYQLYDSAFTILTICVCVLAVFSMVGVYYKYLLGNLKFKMQFHLKKELLNLCMLNKYNFFVGLNISAFNERVNRDSTICLDFYLQNVIDLITTGLTFIIAFIILIKIDMKLAVIIFVTCVANVCLYIYSYHNIFLKNKEYVIKSNEHFGIECSYLQKFRLIKIECLNEFILNKIKKSFNGVLEKFKYYINSETKNNILGSLLNCLSLSLILIFSVQSLQSNVLTLGDFIIVFNYYNYLMSSSNKLFLFSQQMQQYKIAKVRLNNIMEEEKEPTCGEKIESISTLCCDGVSYSVNNKSILSGININFEKGNIYLIYGNNGIGKSTLLDMLVGLIKPTTGSIKANGFDLEELDIKQYRKRVSYASQLPEVFEDTLENNVYFDREDKGLKALIYPVPHNLCDEISEQKLSGGEKRKIILNRAFLKQHDVLILDEPDSFLDEETIDNLIKDLNNMNLLNHIIIIVSHNKKFKLLKPHIINL